LASSSATDGSLGASRPYLSTLSVVSYPHRQVARRLIRAAVTAGAASVTALVAMLAAGDGAGAVAGVLVLVTAGLAVRARDWARLAARSRVGAQSERQVRRALEPLEAEGWRLRHSMPWQGRGDIDHVAIAPRNVSVAVAIETKTKAYRREHVAHAAATARWLASQRRSWCPRGALAVLCLVRVRGVQSLEDDVLVVSVDRLPAVLRTAVGMQSRPAFLANDCARLNHLDRRLRTFSCDPFAAPSHTSPNSVQTRTPTTRRPRQQWRRRRRRSESRDSRTHAPGV
jgi:Nuclease-related domain